MAMYILSCIYELVIKKNKKKKFKSYKELSELYWGKHNFMWPMS